MNGGADSAVKRHWTVRITNVVVEKFSLHRTHINFMLSQLEWCTNSDNTNVPNNLIQPPFFSIATKYTCIQGGT